VALCSWVVARLWTFKLSVLERLHSRKLMWYSTLMKGIYEGYTSVLYACAPYLCMSTLACKCGIMLMDRLLCCGLPSSACLNDCILGSLWGTRHSYEVYGNVCPLYVCPLHVDLSSFKPRLLCLWVLCSWVDRVDFGLPSSARFNAFTAPYVKCGALGRQGRF